MGAFEVEQVTLRRAANLVQEVIDLIGARTSSDLGWFIADIAELRDRLDESARILDPSNDPPRWPRPAAPGGSNRMTGRGGTAT